VGVAEGAEGRTASKGLRGNNRDRGGQNRETVAAVQQESGPRSVPVPRGPSPGSSSEAAQVSIPELSSEQIQRLLILIDGPGNGYEKLSGNVNWMLDSGALSHMDCDATMLNKVEQIPLVAIGLPNGTYTMAKEQGSMALGQGLELKNILYVLKLNCNIVSISKLCKQLNCAVICFDDFCVIQDHTSRTLIGVCEQREGVHYYKKSSSNQVNTVNTGCLLHKRLGHPSNDILSLLSHSLGENCGLNKIKDKLCEICLHAK